MAVFTPVSLEQLSDWLKHFPLGAATSIKGISSGIENSNFFIGTERGEYVLTLFEKLHIEQLPFYLELMRHLADRGIPVPAPVANDKGAIVSLLNDKPAAIVSKLEGQSQLDPQPVHCAALGDMLARMHLAAKDFKILQPNLRGLAWWLETTPTVLPFLPAELGRLLADEVQYQKDFAATADYRALPRGPVHADLFRNNAMFVGEQLSGIFDFYFAGCDTWLFDLAVTVNDWCVDLDTGVLDQARTDAMLAAYRAVRPFSEAERTAWQPMLRAAALRFWLSRLYDFYMPRAAEMLTPHDPTHFERILRLRIAETPPALS